ncbi:IS66 family transposase [Bradyrhizobium sp. USDA 3315]
MGADIQVEFVACVARLRAALARWEDLKCFIDDDRDSLDNNFVERSIRRSRLIGKMCCSQAPTVAPSIDFRRIPR